MVDAEERSRTAGMWRFRKLGDVGEDPLARLDFQAADVLLLIGMLGVTLVVNNFIHKRGIPVPEAISTIGLGCLFGGLATLFPEVTRSTFVKLEDATAKQFMLVFIAPIIFAEGYGLKSRQFFANIVRILAHAFAGTFISTLVVAYCVFYLAPKTQYVFGGGSVLDLTFEECLCFGALISSTDPVTTLAIFKDQQMVENGLGYLYYSVLGESILNDAVAVTLFGSFGALVEEGNTLSDSGMLNIFNTFVTTFLFSMALGFGCGVLTALVLKFARLGAGDKDEEHFYFNIPEVGVALVMAYVPFLVAEALDLSGIVAIMFAGVAMRHYAHYNLTQVTRLVFLPVVELLATLCETYVFLLLGLGVFLLVEPSIFSISLIFWTVIACLVGRAAQVYPISWCVNFMASGPKLRFAEQHVLWFAGLRGAMAFVCALGFPEGPLHHNRDVFLCTTMVVVGVTVLCLGWPTSAVLRCLDIQPPQEEVVAGDAGGEARHVSAHATTTLQRMGDRLGEKVHQLLLTSDAMIERKEAADAVSTQRRSNLLSHPRLSSMAVVAAGRQTLAPSEGVGGPLLEVSSSGDSRTSATPATQAVVSDAADIGVGAPAANAEGTAVHIAAQGDAQPAMRFGHGRPSAPARLITQIGARARPSVGIADGSGFPRRLSGVGRASVPPLRSFRTICDP